MKVIVTKNYQAMSDYATKHVLEQLAKKPDSVLGLATGSTPIGLYDRLIKAHQSGLSFQQVTTFNLDEYQDLGPNHPNSYRHVMDDVLFDHIDINKDQTYVPGGEDDKYQSACEKYEALIKDHGPIDLQVLGLGLNGHIGFNEPGTPFDTLTHVIELDESTRKQNQRFFDSLDEVPTHAITMGIKTIMKTKDIMVLASGEEKKEAVKQLVEGKVTTTFPCSILQIHPNVTVIIDEAASQALQPDSITEKA